VVGNTVIDGVEISSVEGWTSTTLTVRNTAASAGSGLLRAGSGGLIEQGVS
jgi:hypothetical protein